MGWNMRVLKIVYILGCPQPSSPMQKVDYEGDIPPPIIEKVDSGVGGGSVAVEYHKKFFQKN